MQLTYDLLFKGGVVVNHDGVGLRDVGIRDGRIAGIGAIAAESASETVDCTGLHILPGVIDTHVHFREPGNEHKEDLATGSRAAVAGGVTAAFEMPNTTPATTFAGAVLDKLERAAGRMSCDFAFYVGATHTNIDDLAELEALPGVAAVKVFMGSSTGELLVPDDPSIARILAKVQRRVAFHSEDEYRLIARKGERREGDPSSHTAWRDPEAARLATERLLRLARETGKRIHVLHVSTAEELPLLAAARDIATVEVTPHHLTFSAPEAYERLGARAQMNPPIRTPEHQQALWHAIVSGLADTIGSDHAPHTLEEKGRPYPDSPSGMAGVQTLVPIMLDHVSKGRLTIERFVDLTSHGPQRIFGIAGKGRMAEGYDADLTIVDLKRRRMIADEWIESRAKWTPYDGREVVGWPIGTIVRGRRAMWDGEIMEPAVGRAVRFEETLKPARREP
ncbi:MAG: dihydroorotase [Hyphomicrobiales bacterium]